MQTAARPSTRKPEGLPSGGSLWYANNLVATFSLIIRGDEPDAWCMRVQDHVYVFVKASTSSVCRLGHELCDPGYVSVSRDGGRLWSKLTSWNTLTRSSPRSTSKALRVHSSGGMLFRGSHQVHSPRVRGDSRPEDSAAPRRIHSRRFFGATVPGLMGAERAGGGATAGDVESVGSAEQGRAERCGIGSWGGRCPSLADYVTVTGAEVATEAGATAAGRVPIGVEKRNGAFFRKVNHHMRAVLPDGLRRNAPWKSIPARSGA